MRTIVVISVVLFFCLAAVNWYLALAIILFSSWSGYIYGYKQGSLDTIANIEKQNNGPL